MRKSKFLSLLSVSLFITNTAALAQGFYEYIPYYNNDPFNFCTHGVPEDCWEPVDPTTGTYAVTDEYCFNSVSASLYARVCPHAFQQLSVAPYMVLNARAKETS